MKITWLGQAGLLLDTGKTTVMIDPYFSDSVARVHPENTRRLPIDERFLHMTPDVLLFTHDHLDHYDPETAPLYFAKEDKQMTVLCPTSIWQKARLHGGGHNYVIFDRGTEWTAGDVRLRAVRAQHSEPHAIGVVIEELPSGKAYYVTGDTLYHADIFSELPRDLEAVFFPINGVGNNMNLTDAIRFARQTGAKKLFPLHFGMFDAIDPAGVKEVGWTVLKPYEKFEL